jgi:hypothetical protein
MQKNGWLNNLKRSSMDIEKFYEAEKLQKEIDSAHNYRNKLYWARGSESTCIIKYFRTSIENTHELHLESEAKDFIYEMLNKEIDRIHLKISQLQEQFDNL